MAEIPDPDHPHLICLLNFSHIIPDVSFFLSFKSCNQTDGQRDKQLTGLKTASPFTDKGHH